MILFETVECTLNLDNVENIEFNHEKDQVRLHMISRNSYTLTGHAYETFLEFYEQQQFIIIAH